MTEALKDSILRAATAGDVPALTRLVADHGPAIVRADSDPEELSALHLAAASGRLDAVEYLLSPAVGADLRAARINNFTPLHSAAMQGHSAICNLLLRVGAAVNVQTDPQKYSALHSAAFGGHLDAIRVLLAHGADRTLTNYRGERPVDSANRQKQFKAAQLLADDPDHPIAAPDRDDTPTGAAKPWWKLW